MPQWAGSCWYYLRFLDPQERAGVHRSGDRKGLDAGRSVRRRRRARRAAPALLAVLAQGAVRPRPRQHAGAVPEAGEPGDDPGRGGDHRLSAVRRLVGQLGRRSQRRREQAGPEEDGREPSRAVRVAGRSGREARRRLRAHRRLRAFAWRAAPTRCPRAAATWSIPDKVVQEYGADTLRLYEMFMGPLEATKPWSMEGVNGVRNFLDRVWRMIVNEQGGADRAERRRAGRRADAGAEPRAAQDDCKA